MKLQKTKLKVLADKKAVRETAAKVKDEKKFIETKSKALIYATKIKQNVVVYKNELGYQIKEQSLYKNLKGVLVVVKPRKVARSVVHGNKEDK